MGKRGEKDLSDTRNRRSGPVHVRQWITRFVLSYEKREDERISKDKKKSVDRVSHGRECSEGSKGTLS